MVMVVIDFLVPDIFSDLFVTASGGADLSGF